MADRRPYAVQFGDERLRCCKTLKSAIAMCRQYVHRRSVEGRPYNRYPIEIWEWRDRKYVTVALIYYPGGEVCICLSK